MCEERALTSLHWFQQPMEINICGPYMIADVIIISNLKKPIMYIVVSSTVIVGCGKLYDFSE